MVGSREVRSPEVEGAGGEEVKTITINFGSYERTETWKPDGTPFCPHCGKSEVWVECSQGDYYEGPDFFCIACGTSFTMPSYAPGPPEADDVQRMEQLK